MGLNILLKIAIIFLFFTVVDICGHFIFKTKRNVPEWLLTIGVVLAFAGTTFLGVRAYFTDADTNDQNIYMAYCYMKEGNIDQAAILLDDIAGSFEEKELLSVACDVMNGDYMNGHFKLQELSEQNGISKAGKAYLTALDDYCSGKLGMISGGEKAYTDYESYLSDLEKEDGVQETAWSGESDDTGNASNETLTDSLTAYIEDLDFTRKEQREFEEAYELDNKIHGVTVADLTEDDIRDLKHTYGETEEVLRREIGYYVYQNDFDKAKDIASELNKNFKSPENTVIYTDVIVEEVYRNTRDQNYTEDSFDMKDDEIKSLVKKAERAKEKAQKLIDDEGYDGAHADEINELLEKADSYYKDASYVPIKRAVNYVLVQEPYRGDDTGFYELQLSKLYLAMDDRDTANEHLHNVIDNSAKISDSSLLKDVIDEVVTQYNQISDDSYNAELNAAVNDMVDKQSSQVVPVSEETINGSFNSYVATTLKYDRISIHISRIDTTDYPAIRAYININGTKDSKEELADQFTKEDFSVIDTQYEITDFTLHSGAESEGASIGIVMDKSGSMEGAALENAKQAAAEAVDHITAEKMMIISYDNEAYLEQTLTSKSGTLKNSINNISSGGGTNISAGLNLALDNLESANGSRAVILMSDGQDGGSEEDMQAAVDRAVELGISVYTVGFGECDDAYMQAIAEYTGGKFVKAEASTELSDIYLYLQKYIVNNYSIEYTVTRNPEADPRFLTVDIAEYNASETKDYYINEENRPEDLGQDDLIRKVDENTLGISSVTPGNASEKDVKAGITVTVNGGGFADIESVFIGNTALTDIQVTDRTSLTGVLTGELTAGIYDVKVRTTDGRVVTGSAAFKVFKAGTSESVRIGDMTITADSIGQVADDRLAASGNVMINGFMHCSGDMEMIVADMDPELELVSGKTIKAGDSGTIQGDGKLYVSYTEMQEKSSRFADLVMNGRDYIVAESGFYATIDEEKTSFDQNLSNMNISIPFIMDIKAAEVKLYSNRLQIDIDSIRVDKMIKSGIKSLKHETGANKYKKTEKPQERASLKEFGVSDFFKGFDISASVAVTADGLEFGGELTLSPDDKISFGIFGINEMSVKLNSLDPEHEYWKIGGKIDFSTSIGAFGNTGISGFDGYLSSYYWIPDTVKLDANLRPGPRVCEIMEINKVGGELQGMSTLLIGLYDSLVSEETKKILNAGIDQTLYDKDIKLIGTVEAEADLFGCFGDENTGNQWMKKFRQWGEIGNAKGQVEINFSEPEFAVSAEMSLLGAEKAKAGAKINKDGLDISAALELGISGFGCEVKGSAAANLGGNFTERYIKIGVNGNVDMAPVDVHAKGDCKLTIDWDREFSKAKVTLNYKANNGKQQEKSIWYDEDGGLFLWDKISTSSN